MRNRIAISLILLLAGFALPAFAVHKNVRYRHRVRKIAKWNPILKGSVDSMTRQNQEIDRLQLPRIADEQQLLELERTEELVPIRESHHLRWSIAIAPDKRYARPWTRQFVEDMADAYYKEFHEPLQVNSAVRTVDQQQRLRRHNRNAAPEVGELASSHLAGTTVDLSRRVLGKPQHAWVEAYLVNLRDLGLVEVAEERQTWCFHVMVLNRYTEWREANQLADKLTDE